MAQVTSTPTTTSASSAFRLAWPALLAGLLAMAALCAREGSLLSPLPLLALAMFASRFTTWRFEQASQVWMFRLPVFIVVVLLGLARPFPDVSGLYDPRVVCLSGELLAVEMTLQAWRQRPSGGGQGVAMILLSGLIMLAAADSTEDRAIWFFAPAYTLCLALALPSFHPQPQERATGLYRRSAGAWVALALALTFGVATHIAFRVHQEEITEWGMQMLHETPAPEGSGGALSTTPTLGPSFGLQGSDERSYRIEGPRGGELPEHLRVMAYDTYAHRNWLPEESGRALLIGAARGLPPAHPPFWRVTRLIANNGLLAAPLETSGFDPLEQRDVRWSPEMGPLKSDAPVPSAYLLAVGPIGSQGVFCMPPDDQERARLLTLPREMDPKVRDLARQVGGGAFTPEARSEAIIAYLPAHHGYSLSYRPGSGDPVSRFLLSTSAAHCEYFASAAVLLLRCLGVPARYVIGYYAHERDADGRIVVRQRDAHAWAEAWIDGKGWITLDATPADGRPDRDGSVPWWTRISERIGDSLAELRGRLGRLGVPVLLTLAALVGLVIVWRNRPRRTQEDRAWIVTYSTASEEMAALAGRFERICRRYGLVFAPHRTWEEVLNALPSPPPSATAPFDLLDLEAARGFVHAYQAARWGGAGVGEIERLKELLRAMENSGSSPISPTIVSPKRR
jgi:transglutaminase-like putative cysteine protease